MKLDSPDQINDILNTPMAESSMDERTEGEFRGAMHKLAKDLGPDNFCAMGMQVLLSLETQIRASSKPGDPALEQLNRYYAERG